MFSVISGMIGKCFQGFRYNIYIPTVDLSLLNLLCGLWTLRFNRNVIGYGLGWGASVGEMDLRRGNMTSCTEKLSV